jgi:hypothetical protein
MNQVQVEVIDSTELAKRLPDRPVHAEEDGDDLGRYETLCTNCAPN